MIEITLSPRSVYPWSRRGPLRMRGPATEFPDLPADARTDFVVEVLAKWTANHPGSGIIFADESRAIAAVDRSRSFPLFYAREGSVLRISDDARTLRETVTEPATDEEAQVEALLCGFVSGTRTLCAQVHQLRASSVTTLERRGSDWIVHERDCLVPAARHSTTGASVEDQLDALDEIYRGLGERLFGDLQGRAALIPLTAGTDSRCIAMMARACGYDRVICYGSYEASHWETQIAQEVAQRLGYPFLHVPWNGRDWREKLPIETRMEFYRDADGLSALPSFLEWPGVAELQRRSDVPEDGVVLSGHFGDMVSGTPLEHDPVPTRRATASAIWRVRYCLNRVPAPRSENERRARLRIAETLGELLERSTPTSRPRAGTPLHDWEWTEYQAKQIGIVARTYEHHGFEWRFPLIAPELLSFWSGTNSTERLGRRLHRASVSRTGLRWGLPPAESGYRHLLRIPRVARRIVLGAGLSPALRAVRTRLRRQRGPALSRRDGVGWSTLFPPEVIARSYTGLEGVQSFLANEWVASASLHEHAAAAR